MNMSLRISATVTLGLVLLAAAGCQRKPAEAYVPGLGEIMSATQMRHTKLWYAGQAGNWPLADYELDELQEGFDDAVKYHPTHKDAPLPISELLPKVMDEPLKDLKAAISAKDSVKFPAAFDALTGACNSCHQGENFGFNVVMRPTANPYSNQNFEAAH